MPFEVGFHFDARIAASRNHRLAFAVLCALGRAWRSQGGVLVRIGMLMLSNLAMVVERIDAETTVSRFDALRFKECHGHWVETLARRWFALANAQITSIHPDHIYVVYCSGLEQHVAEACSERLLDQPAFLYAGEVGDTNLERWLYARLPPWVFVRSASEVAIFTETMEREPEFENALKRMGFWRVSYELSLEE